MDSALTFILSGNAIFTFKNAATGTRFTFRIRNLKSNGVVNPNVKFVSLLNGPDNTNKFIYMGTIFNNAAFKLTAKSKVRETSTAFQAFNFVFPRLLAKIPMKNLEVWHEGKCGVCGKRLTVPESIEGGIGPICRETYNHIHQTLNR